MTQERPRYAPPRADVADLTAPDALLASRPRSVVWACGLILASMAVGLVSMLPFVDPPMPDEPVALAAFVWGFTLTLFVVELWLLRCVWRRRNWARWVMVALTVLAVAMSVPVIAEDVARAPLLAWLGIASSACSTAALVLLLLPASARWFVSNPAR
jgi:hypothetical protein